MEKTTRINVLYRISKGSKYRPINRPEWFDKGELLEDFKSKTSANVLVFDDGFGYKDAYKKLRCRSNSGSFLECLHYALTLPDNEIVYFVEDDYKHRAGFDSIIREGLERFDYISLYDHPDKHGRAWPTLATASTHWMLTDSTTMTFAAKVETIKKDYLIMERFLQQEIPADYYMWKAIGKPVATPVPGYATHAENEYLSPVIDWPNV